MKERPILFSAPMVRALLDGSKTQTRRVMKNPPVWDTVYQPNGWQWNGKNPGEPALTKWPNAAEIGHEIASRTFCPYGKPGDRLWVRESFCRIDGQTRPWIETDYRATYKHGDRLGDTLGIKKRWTPSIHMPRHASRITLEVTGVRVERLQDISQADAVAEGAPPSHPSIDRVSREFGFADFPRSWYGQLWEQINGPGSWQANPWVWVISFKREQSA